MESLVLALGGVAPQRPRRARHDRHEQQVEQRQADNQHRVQLARVGSRLRRDRLVREVELERPGGILAAEQRERDVDLVHAAAVPLVVLELGHHLAGYGAAGILLVRAELVAPKGVDDPSAAVVDLRVLDRLPQEQHLDTEVDLRELLAVEPVLQVPHAQVLVDHVVGDSLREIARVGSRAVVNLLLQGHRKRGAQGRDAQERQQAELRQQAEMGNPAEHSAISSAKRPGQ
jgi:hypothetical protein